MVMVMVNFGHPMIFVMLANAINTIVADVASYKIDQACDCYGRVMDVGLLQYIVKGAV